MCKRCQSSVFSDASQLFYLKAKKILDLPPIKVYEKKDLGNYGLIGV
jgi:hypothetical protein